MGADDDIDRAVGEPGFGGGRLRRRHQPRQLPDIDRKAFETFGEVFGVLARQQRRRHHHGDLLAVDGGVKSGAHRDFGFAEADIAAHQPVHRTAGRQILERGVDGA